MSFTWTHSEIVALSIKPSCHATSLSKCKASQHKKQREKSLGFQIWKLYANWYALYIRNTSSAAIPSWLEICGASRDFESWFWLAWILTKISQLSRNWMCLMCVFNIFAPMITKKDTKSRRLKDVKPQNSRRNTEKSHTAQCWGQSQQWQNETGS